jgi:hypothetical protein
MMDVQGKEELRTQVAAILTLVEALILALTIQVASTQVAVTLLLVGLAAPLRELLAQVILPLAVDIIKGHLLAALALADPLRVLLAQVILGSVVDMLARLRVDNRHQEVMSPLDSDDLATINGTHLKSPGEISRAFLSLVGAVIAN